jgi:hypothetical protein
VATTVTDKTTGENAFKGLLTRGTKAAIDSTPILDGKIRVSTDTHQLFFDTGLARIEITDVIRAYTAEQIIAGTDIPSVFRSKILVSSDTKHIYVYTDSGWADITGSESAITSVTESGSGNAYTSVTNNDGVVILNKGQTFLTAHPDITIGTDTTSTYTESDENTSFDVIDTITKDSNGHVTSINTKTVNLFNYDFGDLDGDA